MNETQDRATRSDYLLLGLLIWINVLNLVDRNLIVSLSAFIVPDLELSNTEFGLPVINVPTGRDHNNVPTGMQIVGPAFRDEMSFRVAMAYERQYRLFTGDDFPTLTAA